jgi:hypothetical protein
VTVNTSYSLATYWLRRLRQRLVQMAASQLYLDRNPDPKLSILVAGTARSGTTWLGDIIAGQIPCRIMFEPFNADRVPDYRQFNRFQYMRPHDVNARLTRFAKSVMTGRIRDAWVDRRSERILFAFRLIKEIRVSLMLKWLHAQFPCVPLLFVIRHPCAVVQSRMALGWATDADIEPCLSQPALVDDFLQDKLDVIRRANTPEEKHAVVWAIAHCVPLQQFTRGELTTVFYEDLCTQPEIELPRIFSAIQQPFNPKTLSRLHIPSSTSTSRSAILTGKDRVGQWKVSLSTAQIDRILKIVEAFGLGELYADSTTPRHGSRAIEPAARAA